MIFLFVRFADNPLKKRRFLASDSVGWRDSLHAMEASGDASVVGVEFPSEKEFFGEAHTAEVSLL